MDSFRFRGLLCSWPRGKEFIRKNKDGLDDDFASVSDKESDGDTLLKTTPTPKKVSKVR